MPPSDRTAWHDGAPEASTALGWQLNPGIKVYAPATLTDEVVSQLLAKHQQGASSSASSYASLAFIDTFACMLAGTRHADTLRLACNVATGVSLTSTLVGHGTKAIASDAALVNGFAAHVNDYDDYDTRVIYAHPSVVLVPAILAVAEEIPVSGEKAIAAYLAGYNVLQALGLLLNPEHYNKGYHSTGTIGAVGAAVATSILYDLDARTLKTAIAIASSMMAGLRANFGTSVKPFHAAHASSSGIRAAQLAKAGFTAAADPFSASAGIMDVFTFAPKADPAARLKPWLCGEITIESHPPSIKPYASCGCTHSAIFGAIKLTEALSIDDITAIEIDGPALYDSVLSYHRPTDGFQAKFSMEGSVAIGIVDRKAGLDQFTSHSLARADVQKLIGVIRTASKPALDEVHHATGALPSVVTLKTKHGTTTLEVPDGPGTHLNPLTHADVIQKLNSCAGMAGVSGNVANRIGHMLGDLPKLRNLAELFNVLG